MRQGTLNATKDDPFGIIEWDVERFGVGIRQIDEQHRWLLSIINNMCRFLTEINDDPESISPSHAKRRVIIPDRHLNPHLQRGSRMSSLLDDLVTYCAKHLTAEELLLETHSYTDRFGHAAEHEMLVNQISRAHKLSEEGNMETCDATDLVVFLKRWMNEHIPRDRRFAPLLLDKGYGSA